ncbi:hypothetical protein BGM26_11300 [Bacillus sp. FJAT-29790]|uniref:hypothetical protein n=1 Tax=Bacillus sp. FJAT-29790 TaxID=1895002 RepID=UPI001C23DE88|nr:hypothetical protein [Bacillus sp. FJAT-29790]MBU8879572.1 hypothetical protein [Bacillus sp. FJAT-29790]
MHTYLFALASLIILVPFVYFLPLGLTKKGKLVVLAVSFGLAALGLTANAIFEWWQITLLVFTLAILSSFLLDKKINHLIFVDQSEGSSSASDVHAKSLDGDLLDNMGTVNETKQMNVESEIIKENDEYLEEQLVAIRDDEANDSVNASQLAVSKNDHIALEEDEEYISELFAETQIEKIDELEQHTDDTLINFDKEEITDIITEEIDSDQEFGYMSELEKLIFDDPEDLVGEVKSVEEQGDQDPLMPFDPNKVNLEEEEEYLDVLSQFESIADEVASTVEKDLVLEGEKEPKEQCLERISLKDQADNEEFIDFLSQFESIQNEVALTTEEERELGNAIEANLQYPDELSENNIAAEIPQTQSEISNLLLKKDEDKNKLQQQMFKTLLAQTELARKSLDNTQYEKMLKACMHPQMPYSEYYTFASLLIKHYISTKEYVKLHELMKILVDKYAKYPVLMQEIQFLLTYYPLSVDDK